MVPYKKTITPTDPILESAKSFVANWVNRTHGNNVEKIEFRVARRHNKDILINVSFIYKRQEHKEYYVCKVDYDPVTRSYVTRLNNDARFKFPSYGKGHASVQITTSFDELYDPSIKYQRKARQPRIPIVPSEPKRSKARDLIARMVRCGHDGKIHDIILKLFGYDVNAAGFSVTINGKEIKITDDILENYDSADGFSGYQFNFPINGKDRLVRIIFDKGATLCSLQVCSTNTSFHIYTDAYFISPVDDKGNGIDLANDGETMNASNTEFRYQINLSDKESLIIYYSFSEEYGGITFPNEMESLKSLNNPDLEAILTKIHDSKGEPDQIIGGQSVYKMGKFYGYNEDIAAVTGMIFFSTPHKKMIVKNLSFLLEKQEGEISETFSFICSLLRQEKIARIFGNITPASNQLETINTYDKLRPLFEEKTSLYVSPLNTHMLRLPNSTLIYSGNYEVDDIPGNMKQNTNYLKISYNPCTSSSEFRIVFGYLINKTRYFINITFSPNKSMRFLLEIRIGDDTIQIKKGNICRKGLETNFELAKNNKTVLSDLTYSEAQVIVKDILKSSEFISFVCAALNGLGLKKDASPIETFSGILRSLCAPEECELIDSMINSVFPYTSSPIPLSVAIANLERRVIYSIPTIEAFNEVADKFIPPTAPIEIDTSEKDKTPTISRTITRDDTTTRVSLRDNGYSFTFHISKTVEGSVDNELRPDVRPKEYSYLYQFALDYNLIDRTMILEIPLHRFSCHYQEQNKDEKHIARPVITIKIDPKNRTYILSGDGVIFDINKDSSSIWIPKEHTFWTPSQKIMELFYIDSNDNPKDIFDKFVYDTTLSNVPHIDERKHITYVINESKGFKNILIRLFTELGLADINELPDILNMIFSLAGEEFIKDFFGSIENKDKFISELTQHISELTNNVGSSQHLLQTVNSGPTLT